MGVLGLLGCWGRARGEGLGEAGRGVGMLARVPEQEAPSRCPTGGPIRWRGRHNHTGERAEPWVRAGTGPSPRGRGEQGQVSVTGGKADGVSINAGRPSR